MEEKKYKRVPFTIEIAKRTGKSVKTTPDTLLSIMMMKPTTPVPSHGNAATT